MPNAIRILRSVLPAAQPTGRQVGEPYVNFASRQFGVFNGGANSDLLAVRFWALTAGYATGDFVINLGQLWVAQEPISPGFMFDPQQWRAVGSGSAVTIGDTPPANPSPGDLWWHSESGQMFVRYQDPDSSQWVAT